MAECNVDKVILRAISPYLDEIVRQNVNEFHPVDETEAALQTYGLPSF